MRAFLAVAPGGPFTAALSSRLDVPRAALPLRWTRPEAWHLTLQFLDDWPQERLEGLRTALDGLDPGPAFALRPGPLGAFPDLGRPRVLFLHLLDDGQAAALARQVRAAVDAAWPGGPQDTKPFRPHLTVARVRAPLGRDDLMMLADMDLSGLPEIPVEGFSLMASQLRPDGARHRELASWGMRKKGE